MIKLVTSFFLIVFLASCKIQKTDQILDIIPDKETIKKVVKALKKASKAHAGQAKTLKGVINGGSKNRNR